MLDREKVINELVKHIESALTVDSDYVDCVRTDLLQTVVGLLKKQELIQAEDFCEPIFDEAHSYVWDMWRCGVCKSHIYYHQKYCGTCGKAVKWDDEGMVYG